MDEEHYCESPYNIVGDKRDMWVCKFEKFFDNKDNGLVHSNVFNDNICYARVKFCPYCGYKYEE